MGRAAACPAPAALGALPCCAQQLHARRDDKKNEKGFQPLDDNTLQVVVDRPPASGGSSAREAVGQVCVQCVAQRLLLASCCAQPRLPELSAKQSRGGDVSSSQADHSLPGQAVLT